MTPENFMQVHVKRKIHDFLMSFIDTARGFWEYEKLQGMRFILIELDFAHSTAIVLERLLKKERSAATEYWGSETSFFWEIR